MAKPHSAKAALMSPVMVGQFRARLKEMIDRAEAGEDVIIARGDRPVAKLIPMERPRPIRFGTLKEFLSEGEIAELSAVIDAPLSPEDQAAIEGALSDDFGMTIKR